VKNNRSKIQRITFLGLFTALALLLSYVEFLLPPLFAAIPGIKLGLPNIVIIFVLYRFGLWNAAAVSFLRLAMSSLLFGTVMTFAYSLAGAVLSLVIMVLLKKLDIFSTVIVSIAGGVCHNIGQILVAVLLLGTPQIAYYLIVLMITGTISGAFVGLCGALMIKRISIKRP
jgi:heptaprenyl diphosphate synthase